MFNSPMLITPAPPPLTALGEGLQGSILSGSYAPTRLSSGWKSPSRTLGSFISPAFSSKSSGRLQPFSNSSSDTLEIVIVVAPLRKHGPDHRYKEFQTLQPRGADQVPLLANYTFTAAGGAWPCWRHQHPHCQKQRQHQIPLSASTDPGKRVRQVYPQLQTNPESAQCHRSRH